MGPPEGRSWCLTETPVRSDLTVEAPLSLPVIGGTGTARPWQAARLSAL